MVLLLGSTRISGQVDPVETYLSSAEQKATSVVNNAGARGQGIAMEAGQAALNAISAFRAAYGDSLMATEGTLDRQQAQLFGNIKAMMEQLDRYARDSTINLGDATRPLAESIKNLPFSKDIPRVTKVAPLYTVEGSDSEIVFSGIGLSNGDPVLVTATGNLQPTTETDSEIRFRLPPQSAQANQRPALVSATLQVFERKTTWLV